MLIKRIHKKSKIIKLDFFYRLSTLGAIAIIIYLLCRKSKNRNSTVVYMPHGVNNHQQIQTPYTNTSRDR